MSRTAEIILGLTGGIFGLLAGMLVVFVEITFTALGDQSAGWLAIFFSVMIIVGTVIITSKPKLSGVIIIIGVIGGLYNIGLFYVVPGILAFIAGIMALVRKG